MGNQLSTVALFSEDEDLERRLQLAGEIPENVNPSTSDGKTVPLRDKIKKIEKSLKAGEGNSQDSKFYSSIVEKIKVNMLTILQENDRMLIKICKDDSSSTSRVVFSVTSRGFEECSSSSAKKEEFKTSESTSDEEEVVKKLSVLDLSENSSDLDDTTFEEPSPATCDKQVMTDIESDDDRMDQMSEEEEVFKQLCDIDVSDTCSDVSFSISEESIPVSCETELIKMKFYGRGNGNRSLVQMLEQDLYKRHSSDIRIVRHIFQGDAPDDVAELLAGQLYTVGPSKELHPGEFLDRNKLFRNTFQELVVACYCRRGGLEDCRVCGTSFGVPSSLQRHLQRHDEHPLFVMARSSVSAPPRLIHRPFDTEHMPYIPMVWISDSGKLYKHYKCRYCPESSFLKDEIVLHETMHAQCPWRRAPTPWRCSRCSFSAPDPRRLCRHHAAHFGARGFVAGFVDPFVTDTEQLLELCHR